MVIQILANNRKPKVPLANKFSNALGVALEGGNQLLEKSNQSKALRGSGVDPNLPPEMQKLAMEYNLKGQLQQNKNQAEERFDLENIDNIKNTFGEKFANLWKAAPIGGKTELLKNAIETKQRGIDLDQVLSQIESEEPAQNMQTQEREIPQMKGKNLPEDFEWPDFSKRQLGYTPKEWSNERKSWRKENIEPFTENAKRLKNRKADVLATKKLDQLNKSDKLPEGLERFLINPETGDFYGVAQVAGFKSPEAQEWSKIISRFQNRAKDAFGSRVTNFDLQSYMQQFPGLLNTKEGRGRIIDMMKINYKLDDLYDSALDKVYKKYGLNGIPFEEADRLATGLIENQSQKYEQDFLNLEDKNLQESIRNQAEEEPVLSGKMIDVIGPDGQEYEIDESELTMLPEGFKRK